MARAAQQPGGVGSPRGAGNGPVKGCGIREWDMGWEGRPKAPSNGPVGLGNGSPWSGEPWASHGEPDHGKTGKRPELRNGRKVSAGVRVDLEMPGSMA